MRLRRALAVLTVLSPAALGAQGSITITAGATPMVTVAPGTKFSVPVLVDMTAAGGANLASLSTNAAWSASRITLDSVKTGTFGSLTSNNNAGAGTSSLSIFSANGTTSSFTMATMWFTAAGTTGGTRVMLTPTVAGDESGANILSLMRPRYLDICVAQSGKWGDVNADNSVNIIDAQQIARYSVGLSVANQTAVTNQGDVTADGNINIIDAQQIARFSVGLSAAARVNTSIFTAPTVASVTLSQASPSVSVGGTLQLTATPRDGSNGDLSGCAPVAFTSSDPSKATVNESGFVKGIANGTTTITATSGTQSAQVTVTVGTASPPAVSSVAFGSGQAIVFTGSTTATSASAKDANGNVVAGTSLTYTTRDASIATVNSGGTITGVARGQTVILVNVTGSPTIADSLLAVVGTPGSPVLVTSFPRFSVKSDTTFTVSVFANMGASSAKVASGAITVVWNPAVMTYVSHAAGASGSATVNTASTSTGNLSFAFADGVGFSGNVELLQITFHATTTIGAGGVLAVATSEITSGDYTNLTSTTMQSGRVIIVR